MLKEVLIIVTAYPGVSQNKGLLPCNDLVPRLLFSPRFLRL